MLFTLKSSYKINSFCVKCVDFLRHVCAFAERISNSLHTLGTKGQQLQPISVEELY